jgi:hypothetical protein
VLLVAAAIALGAAIALFCAMMLVGLTGAMRNAAGHVWNVHMFWLTIGAGTLFPAATLLALLSMNCGRDGKTSDLASSRQMEREGALD